MEAEMKKDLKGTLHDRGIKGDDKTYFGSRTGVLTTSAHSKIPTLTVEMAFLSNKRDAGFIKTERGQQQMAEALAKGIMKFLKA
jgi:N-acetylmuramoyl-L-alanine amidase